MHSILSIENWITLCKLSWFIFVTGLKMLAALPSSYHHIIIPIWRSVPSFYGYGRHILYLDLDVSQSRHREIKYKDVLLTSRYLASQLGLCSLKKNVKVNRIVRTSVKFTTSDHQIIFRPVHFFLLLVWMLEKELARFGLEVLPIDKIELLINPISHGRE